MKKPAVPIFTLQGVDAEIQKIQDLMTFDWLDYAFGAAETLYREDKVFPGAFVNNVSDSVDLSPNDQYGNYCFWTYSEPGEYLYNGGSEYRKVRKSRITYNVSCIFFIDLHSSSNWKEEKTKKRQDVIDFFDNLTGYPGTIVPTEIIDHSIIDVFEGFELDADPKMLYLPYYGIRVNFELTYQNECE
jgi:hypothetical protein